MRLGDKVFFKVDEYGNRPWEEGEVVGETSRSWLVGKPEWLKSEWGRKNLVKTPKKDADNICHKVKLAEKYHQDKWIEKNRFFLGDKIRFSWDYERLKKVAEIMEYEEQP